MNKNIERNRILSMNRIFFSERQNFSTERKEQPFFKRKTHCSNNNGMYHYHKEEEGQDAIQKLWKNKRIPAKLFKATAHNFVDCLP